MSVHLYSQQIAWSLSLSLSYLEEQEKQELEDEISINEVWHALNGFQNDKTPGDDGFTKEFYEAVFDLLGRVRF